MFWLYLSRGDSLTWHHARKSFKRRFREDLTITEKALTGDHNRQAAFRIYGNQSRPSLMIIAPASQFHVYLPWIDAYLV